MKKSNSLYRLFLFAAIALLLSLPRPSFAFARQSIEFVSESEITWGILGLILGAFITYGVWKIREAKSLAARRLAAIEAAGDGIGIVDANGNLAYMNQALMSLHEISEDEIRHYIGKHWSGLYNARGKRQIDTTVMPQLTKNKFWRAESPIVTKKGNLIHAELSLTLLPDGGFIGTARDISGRKRDQLEKEKLQNQFAEAQKMEAMGALTGGIAHDFNNMLTIISGNLEMLEDKISSIPESKRYLQAARRAVSHGAALTQRLLAFSRKQVLAPEVADVNKIVPETVKMMRRTLGERIEVLAELSSDLWKVRVDTGQLENALINLSINARDAMPDGGTLKIKTQNISLSEVDIKSRPYMTPGQYIMILVKDSGQGIPSDIIDRVFDPFFTTKGPGEGSGLGLSMVYGFTKQSGGFVTIESQVGTGTTVTLYFPRVVESALLKSADKTLPLKPGFLATGNENILVVEDEKQVLAYNKNLLTMLGYHVWGAKNGKEALELLDQIDHIDLLITDVIMPGSINGRDLAEKIRTQFPETAVMFVSGYAHDTLSAEVLSAPRTAFVAKPYTREQISQKIRELLDAKN